MEAVALFICWDRTDHVWPWPGCRSRALALWQGTGYWATLLAKLTRCATLGRLEHFPRNSERPDGNPYC